MSDDMREKGLNSVEPILDKERFWQVHVSAWEGSGMSQAEYCRRKGIDVRRFNYWKRKLLKSHSTPAGLSLIPVRIRPSSSHVVSGSYGFSPAVRVVLGSGVTIEVGDGFRSETLEKVVKVLGIGV